MTAPETFTADRLVRDVIDMIIYGKFGDLEDIAAAHDAMCWETSAAARAEASEQYEALAVQLADAIASELRT